jgi:hypothetical protein
MNTWQGDKKWSDKFLPDIKRVLGEFLIKAAPIEEDAERNTDLIVLKLDAVRIACRIRRYEYWSRYPDQFTIRSGRPSGIKTELTKIIEGWGDYFFYGFSDEKESSLISWTLCDLKVFRVCFNRKIVERKGLLPGILQKNGDSSSSFIAFSLIEFPKEFIIARKVPEAGTILPIA